MFAALRSMSASVVLCVSLFAVLFFVSSGRTISIANAMALTFLVGSIWRLLREFDRAQAELDGLLYKGGIRENLTIERCEVCEVIGSFTPGMPDRSRFYRTTFGPNGIREECDEAAFANAMRVFLDEAARGYHQSCPAFEGYKFTLTFKEYPSFALEVKTTEKIYAAGQKRPCRVQKDSSGNIAKIVLC